MTRFLSWIALATVLLGSTALSAAERYGGIEIGAKGIKTAAVEVTDDGKLVTMQLEKEVTNASISRLNGIKFSQAKIDDVAFVVKQFKDALMNDLNVPAGNISVVASSGVPTFASNYADLAAKVEEVSGLTLSRIDAREEASLTNLALIPAKARTTAMVIDIGSGNTKGGTFVTGSGTTQDFAGLDASFGTATFAQEIETAIGNDGGSAVNVSASLAHEVVGKTLEAQIAAKPVLSQRKTVLFSGGSVWAMMTMLKPQTALDPFPAITTQDVAAYRKLMEDSYPNYPAPKYDSVTDEDVRKEAKLHYDLITGGLGKAPIFSPMELLAGSAIVAEISDVMKFDSRSVYFDRKALTAWITAKITPEDMRDQIPAALGRTLPTGFSSEPPPPSLNAGPAMPAPPVAVAPNPPATPPPVAAPIPAPPAAKPPAAPPVSPAVPKIAMNNNQPSPGASLMAPSDPPPAMSAPSESISAGCCGGCGGCESAWIPSTCCRPRFALGCCRPRLHLCRRACHFSSCGWSYSYPSTSCCGSVLPMASDPITAPMTQQYVVPTKSVLEKSHVVSASIAAQPVAENLFRTWHNADGIASQTSMKIVSIVNGYCVFEKSSGELTSYPLESLSDEDQTLLADVEQQSIAYQNVLDSDGKPCGNAALLMAGISEAIYLREDGTLARMKIYELSGADFQFVMKHGDDHSLSFTSIR